MTEPTQAVKIVKCPNCGAEFEDKEPKCPYCGHLHLPGAEKAYMSKLEAIHQNMGEMKDDMEETYVRDLKHQGHKVLRIFLVIAGIILAILAASFIISGISNRKEAKDEEVELAFRQQYFPELDELYAQGDDEATLSRIYELYDVEGSSAMWNWPHYDYFSYYGDYYFYQHSLEAYRDSTLDREERTLALRDLFYDSLRYGLDIRDKDLKYRNLTPEEKEKVLGWIDEMGGFLSRELKMDEETIRELYDESCTTRSGFEDQFLDYAKFEKAVGPYLEEYLP